jgi:flagellar hook-associated protein 3 FlgL
MAIRMTQNQTSIGFNGNLQSIYAQLAKSQQQIADGRRITKPSDDPTGTGQVIDYDSQLKDVKQYQTNVSDAQGFLSSADGALSNATAALEKIKNLALQAKNGSNGTQDLASIATEITQLKEVVRDSMNAQHGNSYIFGGTATGSAPFPTPGNAYVGTANTLQTRVSGSQTMPTSVAGDSVIGVSPNNTLDDIDALVTAINSGNTANIQTAGALVETDYSRVIQFRSQLGATANRLEAMGTRLDGQEERILDARSKIADVDPTQAVLDMNKQETMYQAALASGTKIMSTTILDYL